MVRKKGGKISKNNDEAAINLMVLYVGLIAAQGCAAAGLLR